MIPSACLYKNAHEITSIQTLYFIDLFKLFVASTSWRIPEHRSNRIFDYHPTRIFESFQGTI